MHSLPDHYGLVAPSLPKVFMQLREGDCMVGTGICIAPHTVLTCAHVVLGRTRLNEVPVEKLTDWRAFHTWHISSIVLIDHKGAEHSCEIIMCDPALDIAVLRTPLDMKPFKMDPQVPLQIGADIIYYGYPYTIQNKERAWPLSMYRGTVSTFADVCVGGTQRRPFAVLQGLVFGGVSGGPVFDAASGALVGMINGQMNWGRNDVLIAERNEDGSHKVSDTDTPLPVGYATAFSFLHTQGIDLTST